MRIGIVGAGAVGGYFGAKLALAGSDVTFVARGGHGEAMRHRGLQVLSPAGDFHLPAPQVSAPGDEGLPFDVLIIAVKMYDLGEAARGVANRTTSSTAVVPLQNGVEARSIIGDALPGTDVMGGVAYIGGAIEGPGVIRHGGGTTRVLFGAPDGMPVEPLLGLASACERSGIDFALSDDIEMEIWRKFAFLAPFAGITCYARQPIGPVRADRGLWERYGELVRETVTVAEAKGASLPAGIVEDRIDVARNLPEGMQSSMLTDLLAGRRLELDWLTGAVVRLGQETGTPTPVSSATLAAIRSTLGAVA